MALVPTESDPMQRGVSVRIGHAQPTVARRGTSGLCVIGVCSGDFPWLADSVPEAVVRDTRYRTADGAVEHVRLRSRHDLRVLPSLSSPTPSRLRDAVTLGLTAGAPEVDVLLARNGTSEPWEIHKPSVTELLEPFLSELPGAIVVYPDLGGPVPTGPGTEIAPWERRTRFLESVRAIAPGLVQRYQLALLDTFELEPTIQRDLLRGLVGSDVALCGWSGEEQRLRAHGWRSAAAVVGGLMAADGDEVGTALAGRSAALPPGRAISRSREHVLSLDGPPQNALQEDDNTVRLQIHRQRDVVQLAGEPTFRQPVGEWSLAALRAVKIVHRQLVRAADAFVFRNATDTQAAALAGALKRAVRPYSNRGLLVGERGEGAPKIRGGVDAHPGEPGLHAIVTAQLRPWSQKVVVRVAVRPGHRPELEVQ